MRLDDLNKISLDYDFSYILTAIYKINLNNKQYKNSYIANISERKIYVTCKYLTISGILKFLSSLEKGKLMGHWRIVMIMRKKVPK